MKYADDTASVATEVRAKLHPWSTVAMLWCVSFFNYADRTALFTVMPIIRGEYHLTATQLGLLSSVFLWIYALAALPAGWLADRFSRRKVILSGLIAWSAITFLTPFAGSFTLLLLLRALTGLGEAAYYPAGTALISDHHAARTRGRALALHQTAVFVGGGIGAFVAAALAEHYGWRAPFLVYGVAGILLALVLMPYLADAPKPPRSVNMGHPATRVREVVAEPRVLLLCGAFFCGMAAAAGITVWAPTFFHDVHGLSLTQSSIYGSASINIAGLVAVPVGGVLADAAAARWQSGRFIVLSLGLVAAGLCLLPIGLVTNPETAGLLLVAAGASKGVFDGAIYAGMHDLVEARARGMAVGAMTTIGFAGGGLAPLLVVLVASHFGLAHALAALAILFLIGAGLLALLTRCSRSVPTSVSL